MVSRIISSDAKEIINTSFLSLPNINSFHRSEISNSIVASDFKFKILVLNGHPRGLEIAQTPSLGSSYSILQEISFLKLNGKGISQISW
jgi:hypothetical protein